MNVGLFSRRVIDIYNALPERDSIPFFTILKLGFSQAQISYDRQARRAGTSGWSFWARIRSAVDVVVTFSYAPVRLISTIGFLAAVIGVIYALVIIVQSLLFGVVVSGWSSLMVVLLLVSGIQMVTLGFIAEYLWRQSKQIRREPRYIVMDQYGSQSSKTKVSLVSDVDNINVSPDH
jgi:dolichol-phosphate mannosyltransferase